LACFFVRTQQSNIRKNKIGFRNDTNPGTLTKEKVEMIIKEIERRKTKN
jgi:hypothetical protein